MGVRIKPSDLYYRYPRRKEKRESATFRGRSDSQCFDRNDLYEVIPMFEAVMDELGSDDGAVLHLVEDVLNNDIPPFIRSRDEVFDCLVGVMREKMRPL